MNGQHLRIDVLIIKLQDTATTSWGKGFWGSASGAFIYLIIDKCLTLKSTLSLQQSGVEKVLREGVKWRGLGSVA